MVYVGIWQNNTTNRIYPFQKNSMPALKSGFITNFYRLFILPFLRWRMKATSIMFLRVPNHTLGSRWSPQSSRVLRWSKITGWSMMSSRMNFQDQFMPCPSGPRPLNSGKLPLVSFFPHLPVLVGGPMEGANDYLIKPLSAVQLKMMVLSQLSLSRQQRL